MSLPNFNCYCLTVIEALCYKPLLEGNGDVTKSWEGKSDAERLLFQEHRSACRVEDGLEGHRGGGVNGGVTAP